MVTRIQNRRDSDASWNAENPVLYEGEIGFDTDSLKGDVPKMKVGDGIRNWNNLPYFNNGVYVTDNVIGIGIGNNKDSLYSGEIVIGDANNTVFKVPAMKSSDSLRNVVVDEFGIVRPGSLV